MRRLRQVFRPVYGDRFTVTPRRWWSRSDRRSARMAAALLDHHADAINEAVRRRLCDTLVYGEPLL